MASPQTRLQRNRSDAAYDQNYFCYYCTWPMWNGLGEALPIFRQRYGFSKRQAEALLCTAEHLQPACEGGSDRRENIVAACHTCNSRRHKNGGVGNADVYKIRIRDRVAKGKWHPDSYYAHLNGSRRQAD